MLVIEGHLSGRSLRLTRSLGRAPKVSVGGKRELTASAVSARRVASVSQQEIDAARIWNGTRMTRKIRPISAYNPRFGAKFGCFSSLIASR